jgi:diaminopimelate decarboxylase
LKVALDAGTDPREISFAGPGKREAELRQAVAAGILINIESFREVELLGAISKELSLLPVLRCASIRISSSRVPA